MNMLRFEAMRFWLLGLLAVTGCNFAGIEGDDASPPEPVDAQESALKVRTICADEVAREIDPMVDVVLSDAFIYWANEPGLGGLRHAPGEDCDVPVYFSDESHWSNGAGARAHIKGGWKPGCRPVKMELREASWDRAVDENALHYIMFHEFGHLLCLPHAETGIMKYDANLGVN